MPDVESIYEVPLLLSEQNVDELLIRKLGLQGADIDLESWRAMIQRMRSAQGEVEIAICGKYVELHDAYKSIVEALRHAGVENHTNVKMRWVNTEDIEERGAAALLHGVDGILVPGGFGERGIEGKIRAIRLARENRVPFFGICLGLQTAVIEFARNVMKLQDANSSVFAPNTAHPVIDLMPDQAGVVKGGTMRLGAYHCILKADSRAQQCYQKPEIQERHRHRWEVNPAYVEALEKHGLCISGRSPDGRLVEIVEIADHPFYVAVQFHPELKSRPERVHPLFGNFVAAAKAHGAVESPRDLGAVRS
jgi:CTP synthase